MFHIYIVRFDVTINFKKFWELNKTLGVASTFGTVTLLVAS